MLYLKKFDVVSNFCMTMTILCLLSIMLVSQGNQFYSLFHASMWQYTFILTAGKELPKQCSRFGTRAAKYASRKSIGVRMPDNAICQSILERLDAPLISTRFVSLLPVSILFCTSYTYFINDCGCFLPPVIVSTLNQCIVNISVKFAAL